MKEQTAVEWLIGEFKIYLPAILEKGLHEKFQQALEMEREQIEHAYDFGNSRIGLSSYGIADGSDYYSNLYDTEE